jgi:hypothetical protein
MNKDETESSSDFFSCEVGHLRPAIQKNCRPHFLCLSCSSKIYFYTPTRSKQNTRLEQEITFVTSKPKNMSMLKKCVSAFSILFFSSWVASYSQTHGPNYIPPTGILSDAGGHKLHLDPQGRGSPTIIFENGSADFSFI